MIPHLAVSRTRLAFILGALAMFGPFSIDTIFPAFVVMQHDLGVSKIAMQQTISIYLLGYAGMSLAYGPLSDVLGRKPVILLGIAIFTVASMGCALSTTLAQILFFRALQGMSAGVGLIVGRAVVRDALDGDDAQRLMSRISMIFGVAPAIAPMIGGWILGWSNWRAIFWFLAAFGIILVLVTGLLLPESHPPKKRMPQNLKVLGRAYAQIISNGRFRLLALAATANFGALFLYIASAPAFVLDLLKLNEQQFSYFFAPTIGGMVLGAFFSGRAAGKMPGIRLANIGFAFCGLSAVFNITYTWMFPQLQLPWAVLPMVLSAFGIALVFPIMTIAILDMYPNQRGTVSSMQAFFGLLSNALIAGALSPMLSNNGLHLALAAAMFTGTAYGLWRWYLAHCNRYPRLSTEAVSLEPMQRS